MSRASLLCLVVWLVAAVAAAQDMPDPSQMSGRPLGAPELADGTVTVRVLRERMGNNVADQSVTVRGGGIEKSVPTDAQGRAVFEGLTPGATVHAETVVDGEILTSDEFAVPEKGGVRIALIAGIAEAQAREKAAADEAAAAPPRAGVVEFGGETRVILEFQDDNLQVFYLLDIVNSARTPIDVGAPLVIDLPPAATNAGALDGSSPLASINGGRVTVTGPFPPGTTAVQFGYRMPWTGDSVRIVQKWPAAIDRMFIAIQKIGPISLSSAQLTAQQEASAGGTPFIMATGGRLNAGDTLTLDVTGLPNKSTRLKNAGLLIAGIMLLVGAWAAWRGSSSDRAGQQARLAARREELFDELVALERQQGQMEPGRHASRRQALLVELERIIGELDHVPEPSAAIGVPTAAVEPHQRGSGAAW